MLISPPPAQVDWSRHALFFDFDGTLTPIVAHPDDVELSVDAAALLAGACTATAGATAIVSGRALDDLSRHIRDAAILLSGSHGAEIGHAGRKPLPDPSIVAAQAALAPFAAAHDLLLETKPGSVALHYRSAPDRMAAVQQQIETVSQQIELRALHGNMVSEATLPGVTKGTALQRIMVDSPFAGRLPVMIGDDVTDEDGFVAAQALGGFGLRIGTNQTAARYAVADIDAMHDWLAKALGRSR